MKSALRAIFNGVKIYKYVLLQCIKIKTLNNLLLLYQNNKWLDFTISFLKLENQESSMFVKAKQYAYKYGR